MTPEQFDTILSAIPVYGPGSVLSMIPASGVVRVEHKNKTDVWHFPVVGLGVVVDDEAMGTEVEPIVYNDTVSQPGVERLWIAISGIVMNHSDVTWRMEEPLTTHGSPRDESLL